VKRLKYLPHFNLQWHITARCDQHCKHCYVFDSEFYASEVSNQLDSQACIRIIDDFASLRQRWGFLGMVSFSGGDPLLREDFFEVIDYTAQKGLTWNIMGNPYHVALDNIRFFKEKGIIDYQISLDGMEATHDFLRRPGSFTDSINAIKLLKNNGIRVHVMFTLSKKNMGDLVDVMNLVDELEVDLFAFDRYCSNSKNNIANIEDVMTSEEYKLFLIRIGKEFHRLKEKGTKTVFVKKSHLWKLLAFDLGLLKAPKNSNLVFDGCSMGYRLLAILADGTVLPCRRLPIKIGKVPEQSISEIFINSEELNRIRDYGKYQKCGRCELLSVCRGCPAVAYGVVGNYYAPDPHCWR